MTLSDKGNKDTRLTPQMQQKLRSPAPESMRALRQDDTWRAIFGLFTADEFSTENWDFLNAVDKFKSDPTPGLAAKIHYDYLRDNAPAAINIADTQRREPTRWFPTDLFDDACAELKARVQEGELDKSEAENSTIDAFLGAVEKLKTGEPPVSLADGGGSPWEIYHLYVDQYAMVPVPLTETTRLKLEAWSTGDPTPNKANFFDVPYHEVWNMISSDTFQRFTKVIGAVQDQMGVRRPAKKTKKAEVKDVAKSPAERKEIVDKWNKDALVALAVNAPARFFQIAELVILEAPGKEDEQSPYIVWAREQHAAMGIVTVTKKGRLFSVGSILAEGVKDEDKGRFTDALADVSDMRVDFKDLIVEDDDSRPKSKPSPFGKVKAKSA